MVRWSDQPLDKGLPDNLTSSPQLVTLAAPEARRRHHGVGLFDIGVCVIFYNACVRLRGVTLSTINPTLSTAT
jgi:hypothetical protein